MDFKVFGWLCHFPVEHETQLTAADKARIVHNGDFACREFANCFSGPIAAQDGYGESEQQVPLTRCRSCPLRQSNRMIKMQCSHLLRNVVSFCGWFPSCIIYQSCKNTCYGTMMHRCAVSMITFFRFAYCSDTDDLQGFHKGLPPHTVAVAPKPSQKCMEGPGCSAEPPLKPLKNLRHK